MLAIILAEHGVLTLIRGARPLVELWMWKKCSAHEAHLAESWEFAVLPESGTCAWISWPRQVR